MEKVLIDTDIVIDLLRGCTDRINKFIDRVEKKEIQVFISLISIVELYAGRDIEDKEKETSLLTFLSIIEILPLGQTSAKLAGIFKRKYHLGLADAVIAATSSVEKTSLFTFNTKHFKDITEINLYPY